VVWLVFRPTAICSRSDYKSSRFDRLVMVAQALVFLADAPRGMATSTEIADVLDVHPVAVRRLLGDLRWQGIVESRSGSKGGWAIARDPSRITLAAVYRALGDAPEVVSPVALDDAIQAAEAAYVAALEPITLASLLGTGDGASIHS
jgi:Rrf2 family protein